MSIDPASVSEVNDALLAYVRSVHGDDATFAEPATTLGRGFDTYIYSFRAAGKELPDAWRAPLVLRLYSTTEQSEKARREAAIQAFVEGRGYPALRPMVVEDAAEGFGLPLMIMRRIEGGTLLDAITSKPWRAKSLLSRMADLHAELHRMPTDGCPLPYEAPLVERELAELRTHLEREGFAHMNDGYEWLEHRKGAVEAETPVLCHHDFHPLNLMLEPTGEITVIDWSDASVGDRHCDVARTITLIWFSQIAATSAVERMVLKAARGFLRGSYLNRYGALLPMDERRLAYWETLHTFWGWAQLEDVAARNARGAAQTAMAQRIPPETLGAARERFWKLAKAFE